MIDQNTIERILDSAQISDVVGEFVHLKKRGVNYLGNCPFHNEKTPSFIVSPAKGIFKCFGCGKAGNVVNFIMEHEHLSYPEALKYLAKKYNVEIADREVSPQEAQRNTDRESMLVVTAYAQKFFSETLFHHEKGIAIGMAYFKERGFRTDTVKKFELGYCPEDRDAFTRDAISKGFRKDYLISTGLTIEKEGRQYDRFFGRVMFPIHNLSGKVIGFGGRTLRTDKQTAKYLNSPESEIYHKSRIVYGIFHAKKAITQFDKCYLVEGYTDVISMHQSGIENVVASSGTSLTTEQIRLIKRFTQNITVIYDGDEAGIKASVRGIDMILEEGMNVKVVLLPDGEDPDSFSQKNSATALLDFLKKSEVDFISFKTNLLMREGISDPMKKAAVINEVVRSISLIPEKITRAVYIQECSRMLDVSENVILEEVTKRLAGKNDALPPEIKQNISRPAESRQPDFRPKAQDQKSYEEIILKFLLRYGNENLFLLNEDDPDSNITVAGYVLDELAGDELEFENPLFKEVFEQMKAMFHDKGYIDERKFINHENIAIQTLAANLFSTKYEMSRYWAKRSTYVETPVDKLQQSIPEIVMKFKTERINKELTLINEEIKNSKPEDYEKILDLMKRKQQFDKLRLEISSRLGGRLTL